MSGKKEQQNNMPFAPSSKNHLTPILLSDDGRIWLALCTVSLAATDEPGHIIMQKNGERSYFEYSTSRHKWEKKEGITLSETECEVLRLSAQGYTMNDIADRLCKSVVRFQFLLVFVSSRLRQSRPKA